MGLERPSPSSFRCRFGSKVSARAVVPVDQERPLVGVVVAGEKHVHSVDLENRQDLLANLDEKAVIVRLILAVAVRWKVIGHDQPVLPGRCKVLLQPLALGALGVRHSAFQRSSTTK